MIYLLPRHWLGQQLFVFFYKLRYPNLALDRLDRVKRSGQMQNHGP